MDEKNLLNDNETNVIAVILAIFLPPLGVLLKEGVSTSLLINCLLTMLGWLPGIVHALYVILKK